MQMIELNSGHEIPIIGVGTYKIVSKEDVYAVIDSALNSGYRAFDTAEAYDNEEIIGKALSDLLPKYKLKRRDVFITSKLATNKQGASAEGAIDETLTKLNTPYLDLFLIHWPKCEGLDITDPKNKDLRAQSYKAMEGAHKAGKLLSIGVSNYTIKHLEEMLNPGPYKCEIVPAVNQVEFNPYLYQKDLLDYCVNKGIHLQAFSSLGSQKSQDLLEDSAVGQIAQKHGTENSVVLLRWAIQHGVMIIPKSRNPQRIKTNMEALKLTLDDDDMKVLDSLTKNKHSSSDPANIV